MANFFNNSETVNSVIKVRRGPEIDRVTNIYEDGELIYSNDKKRLFVGDSVSDVGTFGGILVGNKTWITDSFDKLPNIEKYDLVYRTDLRGLFILNGDVILDPASYILIGGSQIVLNNLPAVASFTLPPANNSSLGGIIVKEGLAVDSFGVTTVDIDTNTMQLVGNKISVKSSMLGGTTTSTASYTVDGILRVEQNKGLAIDSGKLTLKIDNKTVKLSANGLDPSILYVDGSGITLPIAASSTLGAIKVGDGLSATNAGVLNLKKASSGDLGGIKVGSGLDIDPTDGMLSVETLSSGTNTVGLSTNGFTFLPNGFIMQWGSFNTGVGVSSVKVDIKFPLAFPTQCFSFTSSIGVHIVDYDATPNYRQDRQSISYGIASLSGVEGQAFLENNTSDDRRVQWYAIGN